MSVLTKDDSATTLKEVIKKAVDQFNQTSPEMPLGLALFFENSGSSSIKNQILAEQDFVRGTLKNLFFDLQVLYTAGELVPGLGEGLTILGFIGLVTDGQPIAPLELVQSLINKWTDAMLLMSLSAYTPEQLLQFSEDFSTVIRGLFPNVIFDHPVPGLFFADISDYVQIGEVWGFLNWFAAARGAESDLRADQVWGTISVAANGFGA